MRWAAGLVTAAAVAVLLVLILPRLGGTTGNLPKETGSATGRTTPLARGTPTPVQATPTPASEASEPGAFKPETHSAISQLYCPEEPLIFVSALQAGGLVTTCADGSQQFATQSTTSELVESDPSLSPDGSLLAFVRRPRHLDFGAVVVAGARGLLDLSVDVGQDPDLGPNSALAYIDDVPGDGRQPRIVVRPKVGEYVHGRRFPDEAERTFLATMEPDGVAAELTARNLTWDASGDRLWWEAGRERFDLHTAELTDQRVLPRQVDAGPDVQGLLAPATAAAGSVAAIHQSGGVGGEPIEDLEFGLVTLTGRLTDDGDAEALFAPVQGLSELPAPRDPLIGQLFTAAAGAIDVLPSPGVPFRVVQGDAPAWVVGDGAETYLIDADGEIDDLKSSWSGVTVYPFLRSQRDAPRLR